MNTRHALALAVLLSLGACAAADRPIEGGYQAGPGDTFEGSVVEEATGRPIEGAIVVGRWKESGGVYGHSQTLCRHVESAVTGADGRYRMAKWQGRSPSDIDSFKIGYELSKEYFQKKTYRQNQDVLKPSTRDPKERLEELKRVEYVTRCLGNPGSADKREKADWNLLPLRRALVEEARQIARTPRDDALDSLTLAMEALELGRNEARKRYYERRGEK